MMKITLHNNVFSLGLKLKDLLQQRPFELV